MSESETPLSVVVGVDGSRAAVRAAVWAVDEAVSRDIPMRLVHVLDDETERAPTQSASGQAVLHEAQAAAEATGKPVKIEMEIAHGRPLATLVQASRSAEMVCVGPIGVRQATAKVGSTASGLVSSAHSPVAVVRAHDGPGHPTDGWVVVEADDSPANNAVLQRRVTDIHEDNAVTDGNRRVRAQLDRRLAHWTRRHPELEIRSVAVHGTILNYLAKHADSVQLVVVGKSLSGDAQELVGPAGHAALQQTDCSVLVVCPRYL